LVEADGEGDGDGLAAWAAPRVSIAAAAAAPAALKATAANGVIVAAPLRLFDPSIEHHDAVRVLEAHCAAVSLL
jgi:hypothetical protein